MSKTHAVKHLLKHLRELVKQQQILDSEILFNQIYKKNTAWNFLRQPQFGAMCHQNFQFFGENQRQFKKLW